MSSRLGQILEGENLFTSTGGCLGIKETRGLCWKPVWWPSSECRVPDAVHGREQAKWRDDGGKSVGYAVVGRLVCSFRNAEGSLVVEYSEVSNGRRIC